MKRNLNIISCRCHFFPSLDCSPIATLYCICVFVVLVFTDWFEIPRSPRRHPACSCLVRFPDTWWQKIVTGQLEGKHSFGIWWLPVYWPALCNKHRFIYSLFYGSWHFQTNFRYFISKLPLPQTIIPCRDNAMSPCPSFLPLIGPFNIPSFHFSFVVAFHSKPGPAE